ncbi:uncharacterized protein DNG_02627 [Cephalotrichum gorgonifer]|uniref:CENP-T/Histone H4 histone fold domain-containing protein n=1 Tax=Cephalotrichum gorgonifer TaxID=2041049 RepID=A0AAE8MUR7_9PEZI|nr:uncharacterized protein DNG_02627 [Cephalotrichum gorgonifer]
MSTTPRTPAGAPTKITVVTPSRRAVSTEPPSRGSAHRPLHTPLNNPTSRDLLHSVRYGHSASGRKSNAPTPHARAARRALNLRRATMSTPGRNRRRSGREQRETPRDILRALGQVLAPKSRPIPSSSSSAEELPSSLPIFEEEDEDDDLPIDKPRLSLPLELDEEPDLQPPKSSGLEDEENYTVQSVEFPRRATSEQPFSRLSRGSFGDMTEFETMNLDAGGLDHRANVPVVTFEDWGLGPPMDDVTYERIDEAEERRATLALNRESGFGLDMVPDVNESTFMMNLPAAQDDTAPLAGADADADGDVGAGMDEDDYENEPFDDYENEPFPLEFAQDEPQADEDVATPEGEVTDGEATEMVPETQKRRTKKRKRGPQLSRFGIEYPPLPPAVVKRLAQTFAQTSGISKTKITPDTLDALCQASDWFFEQLGDSLGAYAKHAGRKTIDESDIITLMQRQRQIGASTTPFSLAQQHLPREMLQHIRMPVSAPAKKRRQKDPGQADEDG